MEISCYGLTIAGLHSLAYEFCKKNKIDSPFNKEINVVDRDFVIWFLTRLPGVLLRKHEAISLNRVHSTLAFSDRMVQKPVRIMKKF